MYSLKEIQRWVQSRILSTQSSGDDAGMIKESPEFRNDQRWAIYRGAYRERLFEAISDDFPVTLKFLGDRARELVESYFQTFPSHYRSLTDAGQNFPRFLKSQGVDEWLLGVAEFEWALVVVEYAEPGRLSPQTIGSLQTGRFADLKLKLASNVRLIKNIFPIDEIWESGKVTNSAMTYLVVYSKNGEAYYETVSSSEWEALNSVAREALGLEELLKPFALLSKPELVGERLNHWVAEGWLIDEKAIHA